MRLLERPRTRQFPNYIPRLYIFTYPEGFASVGSEKKVNCASHLTRLEYSCLIVRSRLMGLLRIKIELLN
jgi:hypothetical protein